ncbi:hypothetical protein BKA70DRAFT_361751 [Coprinopsis sp. MPI-PUGE-AT-0042]|nr:hypothetical protein BKA70DRAFT_361751 [Coprinopsis sp. MPI-PUGE-AT-0042]
MSFDYFGFSYPSQSRTDCKSLQDPAISPASAVPSESNPSNTVTTVGSFVLMFQSLARWVEQAICFHPKLAGLRTCREGTDWNFPNLPLRPSNIFFSLSILLSWNDRTLSFLKSHLSASVGFRLPSHCGSVHSRMSAYGLTPLGLVYSDTLLYTYPMAQYAPAHPLALALQHRLEALVVHVSSRLLGLHLSEVQDDLEKAMGSFHLKRLFFQHKGRMERLKVPLLTLQWHIMIP